MKLPRVGSVFHFGRELDLDIVSGSNAKKVHIDSDMSLQIIANGEDGPLMKVVYPTVYFGRPISQFSNKLIFKMTFKELNHLKLGKPTNDST